MRRWREAMQEALYGANGFYVTGDGPAAHFRTSAQSALLAVALVRLLRAVDAELDEPPALDVVDVGAGRGELLIALAEAAPPALAGRLRLTAVERAVRPAALPRDIGWRDTPPATITGLLLATEWLDNVPVDVAECDPDGTVRLVLVERATGAQALGEAVSGADAAWLKRWWPLAEPGERAEIGHPRDDAWADAIGRLRRGLALTIDYGHTADRRPAAGTLAGHRGGRAVRPVPDGCTDLTAHVAWDPLLGPDSVLLTQRDALHRLGVGGGRPPLSLATTDPERYVRALSTAAEAGALTDPAGLGAHHWLLHAVGTDPHRLLGRAERPAGP